MDPNRDQNSKVNSPSRFNRCTTLHTSAYQSPRRIVYSSLDRSTSTKKWYNSFDSADNTIRGKVRHLRDLFDPTTTPKSITDQSSPYSYGRFKTLKPFGPDPSTIRLPAANNRVVLFFTSLRGVRRTFEDCYAVRTILRGYRIYVDERDVSMDSSYRKELQSVMGDKNVTLPQVFVRGRYLGGSDIIKHLNEIGELRKILDGLPLRGKGTFCASCGDVRFVPCSNCNGSRKVLDENDDIKKRCPICNENGLVRCSDCLL